MRAVRCRDGCEPARASWRSRPGPGPLPLVCTEGPRRSARPCPQPPELGLAGCGPGRQRPARAPAPAPSRRQAPAGADRVALLHRPVRRQPPARATLPADQPGSADQPRDQGCHQLFDAAGPPRTQRAGRIRPRWLTTEDAIRVGGDGIKRLLARARLATDSVVPSARARFLAHASYAIRLHPHRRVP